jgi:hypothetical protein
LQGLKTLLYNVLGRDRHRVRPCLRDEGIVYLHFLTLEEMNTAKETLTTNYSLTVTVCRCRVLMTGFGNLIHVKKELASKQNVVADLAEHVLRLFY